MGKDTEVTATQLQSLHVRVPRELVFALELYRIERSRALGRRVSLRTVIHDALEELVASADLSSTTNGQAIGA